MDHWARFWYSSISIWPTISPQSDASRSEEHTSELQSQSNVVCRLLLEKKNSKTRRRSQCRDVPSTENWLSLSQSVSSHPPTRAPSSPFSQWRVSYWHSEKLGPHVLSTT